MKDEARREELRTAIRIWIFVSAMIGAGAFVIWMGWEANSGFWRGLSMIVWGVLSHLK